MTRLMIIGWDGATWDYINPLLNEDKLPHLNKLIGKGTKATLQSTIPPFTNVAWPSLITGLLPAKTGVYDGSKCSPGSYKAVPYNVIGYRGTTIWHWINQFGHKAGVMNVPMTFPANELDGYLVTGFDSILESSQITFPQNLFERWEREGQNYSILHQEITLMESQNPHQARSDLASFTQQWIQLIKSQGEFTNWVWDKWPTDLLFVVFSGTDSINHRTNDMESITAVYQAADEVLGKIINRLDEDTLICLVSDHGSTTATHYISLNKALCSGGWLNFRSQIAKKYWQKIPFGEELIPKIWLQLPHQLQKLISAPLLKKEPRLAVSYDNIDWNRTQAFSRSSMGPIYINTKERFPEGTVSIANYNQVKQDLADYFSQLKTNDGSPLFRKVWHQEELYIHPDPKDDLPDLVLEPADWRHHMISGFPTDPLIFPIAPDREYGTHTPDGIFVLAGPNIKKGATLDNAHLTDVVPTVLTAWRLPYSDEIDGRVLQEAFEHPLPEKRIPNTLKKQTKQSNLDGSEIENRLRSLGYLD